MPEENLDCGVAAFAHLAEALDALSALNPTMIVTDYHMPQIHGFELIRRTAQLTPTAAFVLITTHTIADEIVRVQTAHLPAPGDHAHAPSSA